MKPRVLYKPNAKHLPIAGAISARMAKKEFIAERRRIKAEKRAARRKQNPPQQPKKKKSNGVAARGFRYKRSLERRATQAEKVFKLFLGQMGIHHEFQKVYVFKECPRIVDFYIPVHKVAVEIDGSSHDGEAAQIRDEWRSQQFKRDYPWLRFIRFRNEEVLGDPVVFKLKLLSALQALPLVGQKPRIRVKVSAGVRAPLMQSLSDLAPALPPARAS